MRGKRKSQEQPHGRQAPGRDARMPVYHISIVAEMVATHPQTLRMYERMGLIAPCRTRNNIRLYSDDDVATVRRIQHLTQELGVNLAGVEVVFKLLEEIERMRAEFQSHDGTSFGTGSPAERDTPNPNAPNAEEQPRIERLIEVETRHGAHPALLSGDNRREPA